MNCGLVFGGSYPSIEDSSATYAFRPHIPAFELTSPARKGRVFVNMAFLHGDQAFAVGNECYAKSRRVHRHDLDRAQRDLLS